MILDKLLELPAFAFALVIILGAFAFIATVGAAEWAVIFTVAGHLPH